MKLSRMFNSLPKRIASGALLALAVALPVATSAASMVSFDATTGVANVTAGDTSYKSSVNATYNQVVKVEVTYENKEAPSSNKSVSGLTIKFNVPTTAGKSQEITTKVSGSNITTVNGSVAVNLDRSDAYLQYIPGTAEWKHADAQTGKVVEQKISDNIVTGANGLNLGSGAPCQAGSVAISVGVYIPGTKVVKQVELANQDHKWATTNTAQPGDTLKYLITYTNTGNTTAKNVIVRDNLPPDMTYVKGSTVITNSNHPNGYKDTSDAVTTDGIIIGDYLPGAVGYVVLETKIAPASDLKCGETTFTNVGIAHPKGAPEYYNTAYTKVNKTCETPKTPTYKCVAFHVVKGDNRTVTVDQFSFTASDNSKLSSVDLSWGDTSGLLTTNNVKGQTHKYGKDGTYTISLSNFKVNGKTVNVSGNCSQTVTFTTPTSTVPPELPNTGAGNVIGLFGAITIAGAFAHRLFLSRKLTRE